MRRSVQRHGDGADFGVVGGGAVQCAVQRQRGRGLGACRALSVLYYGSYAGADEAFLRLGREVKERGLTPAGDPRVLGIVAPYTGREIETKRYCSRLVLPVEGEAEPSFPV